jgi:hypothetical protein
VPPLRQDRYKVQFTADQQLHDKLKTAQQFMRHQIPDGDIAKVVDRALDLLIAQQRKQHFGATDKPRASRAQTAKLPMPDTDQTTAAHVQTGELPTPATDRSSAPHAQTVKRPTATDRPRTAQAHSAKRPNPDSRYIPPEVKRQVLARDGEQCSYGSPEGRRCQQRERLQFHHKHAYGQGGPATVDNIEIRCSPHNWMHADDDYGRTFMRRRIERARHEREREREASRFCSGIRRPSRFIWIDLPTLTGLSETWIRPLVRVWNGPAGPGTWTNSMDVGTEST